MIWLHLCSLTCSSTISSKLATPIGAFVELPSHANLPCLVNLALKILLSNCRHGKRSRRFRACLHDNNVLKMERFFLFFFFFLRIGNKNDPRSHWSTKTTKNTVLCYQASSWWCHFVKKHYMPIDWTSNTHAHDVTVFTNSCFCSLRGDDNGIIFKKIALWNSFSKVCIFRPPKW